MKQYDVTGMSCAACSARVEKAVSQVPGVTSCSVSLLTNSMGVEGTASPEAIVKAVEEAGYGAAEKGAAKPPAAQAEEALAEIYAILEDPELDDPACMQKIEAIVTVYHRRLGVHSTRHWEQD